MSIDSWRQFSISTIRILQNNMNILIPKDSIWRLQSKNLTCSVRYWCLSSNIWCSASKICIKVWRQNSNFDVINVSHRWNLVVLSNGLNFLQLAICHPLGTFGHSQGTHKHFFDLRFCDIYGWLTLGGSLLYAETEKIKCARKFEGQAGFPFL